MKLGFIYSGQGAQVAGMGKDFYDNEAQVRAFYDEIVAKSKQLGLFIKKMKIISLHHLKKKIILIVADRKSVV